MSGVKMKRILKPAPAAMAGCLAALAAAASACLAETAGGAAPAPQGSTAAEPAAAAAEFVISVIPNANFAASASRMAVAHAQNPKLRELAGELARDQTAVANSLMAWVNVSGPVVTRQSPYAGQAGSPAAKLSAPRLLPAQAETLQRLSAAQGRSFDELYVSSLMEALVRLQTLYHGFGKAGSDPGLQAIAVRELPKVEKTIDRLNAL
ncbi:MAG TPA: DUF4142 domain-containing protein [Methylocella sp.]|nr:DUF4142 domain-containing protein [Methylocella sp.]